MRMRDAKARQKDEEIAGLVQSGKIEFFETLIKRYEGKIKRYARKFLFDQEDINDIVQDVFIKTYKNIKSFDTKKKFSSWIYRIAHNELVNALKKKRKNSLPLFSLDIFLPSFFYDKNNPEQEANRRQMSEIINTGLAQLGPKYREPIILYYFENLSYREIADVLEIPVSTVGIRIKRAKEKMKKIFQKLEYKI